jgi:hypothetical protein
MCQVAPVTAGADSQTLKVASVVQTEATSGVDFAASVCPTAAPKATEKRLAERLKSRH